MVKIHLEINKDNIVHSNISCKGETFERTKECIEMAIQELQTQIRQKRKCPMYNYD